MRDFTPEIVWSFPVISPVMPIPASGKLKVCEEPIETILNLTPALPTTNVCAVLSKLFIEIMPVVANPETQLSPESVELSAVKK